MAPAIPCSKESLLALLLLLLAYVLFREDVLQTSMLLKVVGTTDEFTQPCKSLQHMDSDSEREVEQCVNELSAVRDELMNNTKTINGSIIWGPSWETNKTGGHIETTIVNKDCRLPQSGMEVCCAAVNPIHRVNRGVGVGMSREVIVPLPGGSASTSACKTTKVYFPSSYETEHLEFARMLSSGAFATNESARYLVIYLAHKHSLIIVM